MFRSVLTLLFLTALAFPAAAGMRDTPLCKAELAAASAEPRTKFRARAARRQCQERRGLHRLPDVFPRSGESAFGRSAMQDRARGYVTRDSRPPRCQRGTGE